MKRSLFACLSAFLLLAAACAESPAPPDAARQLLNLGLLVNDAGAKVANGPVRGVSLAISEYNDHRDSTYQVRLRRAVTDGSPAGATQAAARLAGTERLIGAVAVVGAEETAAAAPAFERASIPYLTTSVDGETAPGSRTFRRLVANARQEGAAMARYISRRINAPAIIFHDGSTSGSAYVDGAKEALEAAGRPVLSSQRINARTDLEGVLGSVPRDAPSFVVFGGDGGLAANFADVLRRGGYKGPMVASHQILDAKPDGVPEGLLSASGIAGPADPELRSFAGRFSAVPKAAPAPLAVESYEGALMLLEAIEEVEPRPRELVEFLQLSRSFLGESKSYEYDDNGELRSPVVWVYESKEGAWSFSGRSGEARRASRPAE